MIQQIKTALLGEDPRTGDPWPEEHRDVVDVEDTRHTPSIADVDPFRPDPGHGPDQDRADMDQIFGILGNERRRYALAYLSRQAGSVTMSDLSERIAAWECGKQPKQISSKERKRVYVSLYQCHLPKMADASAISYDKDRGKIEPGDRFDQFVYYLRDDG